MKAVKNLGLLLLTLGISALPLSASPTGHFERTLQVSGTVDLENRRQRQRFRFREDPRIKFVAVRR